MKMAVTLISILFASFTMQARIMRAWSYQELYDQSDVVVIARVTSTGDTTERTSLTNAAPEIRAVGPDLPLVGVSTKFAVNVVMKGDKNVAELTLHHYRMDKLPPMTIVTDGPNLVSFDPRTHVHLLLFLHRESDGRYSPVSGQADPGFSISPLSGMASSVDFFKDEMEQGTGQTNGSGFSF